MKEIEELFEPVRDILLCHLEMCNILKKQGIEPTRKNLDKHFPYQYVGCEGLVCPNCGSKRLWIVKSDWRSDFSKIDVDVFRCIDCEEKSSFYYDFNNGCYKDPDREEAWREEYAADCAADHQGDE